MPVASPTYAPDLAEALLELLSHGRSGVWHIVNDGACSRLELARAAVSAAGLAQPNGGPTTASQRYSEGSTGLVSNARKNGGVVAMPGARAAARAHRAVERRRRGRLLARQSAAQHVLPGVPRLACEVARAHARGPAGVNRGTFEHIVVVKE